LKLIFQGCQVGRSSKNIYTDDDTLGNDNAKRDWAGAGVVTFSVRMADDDDTGHAAAAPMQKGTGTAVNLL
jgi:hypothetical protein